MKMEKLMKMLGENYKPEVDYTLHRNMTDLPDVGYSNKDIIFPNGVVFESDQDIISEETQSVIISEAEGDPPAQSEQEPTTPEETDQNQTQDMDVDTNFDSGMDDFNMDDPMGGGMDQGGMGGGFSSQPVDQEPLGNDFNNPKDATNALKSRKLLANYQDLYKTFNKTSDILSKASSDDNVTIEIIKALQEEMNKSVDSLSDYILNIYNTNTYEINYTNFLRFSMMLKSLIPSLKKVVDLKNPEEKQVKN